MAAFFWIHAGANNNWATNGNWSATSGGGSNAAQPSSTSDVTFDGAGANGNDASTVSANVTILSLSFTTGYTNTVTINTAVILTIAGNFTDRTQHSWTVSGTGSMNISATSTITSNGKTFPGPVTITGANTKTLVGDWTITGQLTMATGTCTINKTTTEVLSCAGWSVPTTTTGTINITLTGGTWSSAGGITVSGTINFAGNVTFTYTGGMSGGTLKYTSGTPTISSTLSISGSETFDTNGMSWGSITVTAAATLTLNSLLTCTATFTSPNGFALTFAGTSGFTVATFTAPNTAAATNTFKNGITYTITTAFNCFLARNGAQPTFTSDDGTLKAIITLNQGATCNVNAIFTRIDASGGRAINTWNGTVTTCLNIFSFTDALPPAIGRVIHAGATY